MREMLSDNNKLHFVLFLKLVVLYCYARARKLSRSTQCYRSHTHTPDPPFTHTHLTRPLLFNNTLYPLSCY